MKNVNTRIISSIGMVMALGLAALAEYMGFAGVKILATCVVSLMIVEMISVFVKNRKTTDKKKKQNYTTIFIVWGLWLLLLLWSAYSVSNRPWIMLLLFMIISFADVGAWGFGKLFGGDKMWEKLSPNKTWSGQIFGIICGTVGAVLYGLLGTNTFMAELMWIGISVSLFSQYGDLTASWLKRKLGIKDFSNMIPGHGGFTDRFDGWIYVLPIIYLIVM